MNSQRLSTQVHFPPWQIGIVVVASVLAFSAAAHACNVPVFRYALEHWSGDSYRLVVFHRGQLTDSEQSLLNQLADGSGRSSANVSLRTVDVGDVKEESDRKLLESGSNRSLPWIAMQYPKRSKRDTPIWSAPLNPESVGRLINSPVREELIRRLIDGQTSVWLLLESGQGEKDEAAAQRLEIELKKLEKELKLPELTDAPEDSILAGPPLRVAFSILRVPRTIEEQTLTDMLLHAESDLAEESGPLVFPVFGRGRALLPLLGAGITAENIRNSAEFLVGPCSCQVKELNPGFDLLLFANWGFPTAMTMAEVHTGADGDGTSSDAELVPIPSGAPDTVSPAETKRSSPAVSLTIAISLLIGSCLLAAITLLLRVRARRRGDLGKSDPPTFASAS